MIVSKIPEMFYGGVVTAATESFGYAKYIFHPFNDVWSRGTHQDDYVVTTVRIFW